MNKVFLIGNLTKDPEIMTTQNGNSITRFTLAVQSRFKNEDGEKDCDFINCVAWKTLADNIYKYLKKGKKCSIVGSIKTRSFDAPDGTKRYVTEINCEEIEFLSPVEKSENDSSEQQKLEPIDEDNLPF